MHIHARMAALVVILLLAASCAPVGPVTTPERATGAPGVTNAPATGVPATTAPVAASPTATVDAAATTQGELFTSGAPAATATLPPRTPTPEAAGATPVQQASLGAEIFLAGAPSFALVFTCEPPKGLSGPVATWQQGEGLGQLCLYGFKEGEEVRYELYDSEQGLVETGVTVPDTFDGPQPAGHILLNVEAFPIGTWLVRAEAGSTRLEDRFEVAPPDGPRKVAIRLYPGPQAAEAGRKLDGLNAGDEVFIRAANLAPDAEIPIAVYGAAEENYVRTPMKLHEQAVMLTDEAGTLSAQITLDPSYAPGFYCVIVAIAKDYEPVRGSGEDGAAECFMVVK